MLYHFPEKLAFNVAGLNKFQFCAVQNVLEIQTYLDGSIKSAISLKAGYSFLNGYATANTLLLSEDPQETEQGIIYDITLSGFMPGDGIAIQKLFANMVLQQFVIIVLDNNKTKRLLGNKKTALSFTYKFTSGADKKESKGYKFSFTYQSDKPAPVYLF